MNASFRQIARRGGQLFVGHTYRFQALCLQERIHRKPDLRHLIACHPWLESEITIVDPAVAICAGASAGRAVLGRPVRVAAERGVPLDEIPERLALVTTHPSALLRLCGRPGYAQAFAELVHDLQVADQHA